MAKFILYIATSLDGYIARSDGSIDWLPAPEINAEDNGYSKFYDSIDALVMGATTYEQVLSFGEWVYPNKLSYVLTSRNLLTTRNDIYFAKGGIDEVIKDVNQKAYQRVWLVGGGKIASSFMERGLISDYIITVIPVILGAGISLYQSVSEQQLAWVETTSYPSGMVELRYRQK